MDGLYSFSSGAGSYAPASISLRRSMVMWTINGAILLQLLPWKKVARVVHSQRFYACHAVCSHEVPTVVRRKVSGRLRASCVLEFVR